MSATAKPPVFRSAAHRRAVMRRLAASVLPTALSFGFLAPLIATVIVWSGALLLLLSGMFTNGDAFVAGLWLLFIAVIHAYQTCGLAAVVAGVWVALLSPFAPNKLQFYLGVAAIGAVTTSLFLLAAPSSITGPFLPVVGAITCVICARLFTNTPLGRGEDGRRAEQDRLAKARAERLAKERAATR